MVGDRVLVCIAQLLTDALRPDDLVARFGGEEFVVVMAGLSLDRAKEATHRGTPEPGAFLQGRGRRRDRTGGFTYSCGMTQYSAGDRAETILRRADEALYEAKSRGKDRIVTRRHSFLRGLLGRSKGHRDVTRGVGA